MHNGAPDKANVIALPPLIYGAAFVVGLLIHLAFLVPILPEQLADWIGAVLALVSFPIALWALRTLTRANTTKRTIMLIVWAVPTYIAGLPC